MLNDFLDKGQFELDGPRHAISNAAHNCAMLKQSLVDQLAQDNKALVKAKADHLVSSRESRSRGGGESLASMEASQVASKNSCARVASDHEASVESFALESAIALRQKLFAELGEEEKSCWNRCKR